MGTSPARGTKSNIGNDSNAYNSRTSSSETQRKTTLCPSKAGLSSELVISSRPHGRSKTWLANHQPFHHVGSRERVILQQILGEKARERNPSWVSDDWGKNSLWPGTVIRHEPHGLQQRATAMGWGAQSPPPVVSESPDRPPSLACSSGSRGHGALEGSSASSLSATIAPPSPRPDRCTQEDSRMASFKVVKQATKPHEGQKPGTSGLRKKVKVFKQENYLANFVQSTFAALPSEKVKGSNIVVSGDGRYWSTDAIQIIIKIAAANGVKSVWVGQNTLLSTPAVSAIIRNRENSKGEKAFGAFILTASHNPGGPDEDFGIKYNCENGGPAPESLTDKIYENSKTISEYLSADGIPDVDVSKIGTTSFEGPDGTFEVEVIDSTEDYLKLMKTIFDFTALKGLLTNPKFTFCFDALHGVSGVYAKKIFAEELGAPESSLMNCNPLEDFGGGHPDPNLTYAKELVKVMGLSKTPPAKDPPEFGAAADGDADRNMILGKRFFVTPSDSVAIIAANAVGPIPYFSSGLKGVARSMPTSAALDVVAKKLNLKFFEVPTGWKFFGNLMDAGLCSVCGEESFGTGSDHIREKDGIWAVLAWLSILAYRNKQAGGDKLVTVEEIVTEHWNTYGRHYYTRYDYENVDSDAAKKVMTHLVELQSNLDDVNKMIQKIHSDVSESKGPDTNEAEIPFSPHCRTCTCGGSGTVKEVNSDVAEVKEADEFEYKDPVDHSVASHQGIRFLFKDGSRLVFRLSGTGSVGATIRMYIEQYEADPAKTFKPSAEALGPLVEVALKLSKIAEFTGRSEPTVIT